jgi:hypothetical protein
VPQSVDQGQEPVLFETRPVRTVGDALEQREVTVPNRLREREVWRESGAQLRGFGSLRRV